MEISEYKKWEELLSKTDFQDLFETLFEIKEKFENEVLVEMLIALSERYQKFYEDILQPVHKRKINSLLIELTDFTSLNRLLDLITIMFNFKSEMYAEYLNKNSKTIISESIKKEVLESLTEFETLKKSGNYAS